MYKQIIILTKSFKHKGYCVAGIDIDTGKWIRIVSDNQREEGAVRKKDIIYSNGELVKIYDIVKIDFIEAVPNLVQPENWLYNQNKKWEFIGVSNLNEVIRLHNYDNPKYIFFDTNKELKENTRFNSEGSLLLLRVFNPKIFIKTFENNERAYNFNFIYNNNEYKFFKITQEDLIEKLSKKSDGGHDFESNNISAIFSLTDKYYKNGKYYKVVAQFLK